MASMNLEHFDQSLHLAARLVERGDYEDALIVMRPWADTDIPDFNKSIVCINLAVVSEHLGREADALAWYDRGIGYELSLGRSFVAERKAAYLAEKGRTTESLMLYETLLWQTSLADEDEQRIRQNIAVLKARRA